MRRVLILLTSNLKTMNQKISMKMINTLIETSFLLKIQIFFLQVKISCFHLKTTLKLRFYLNSFMKIQKEKQQETIIRTILEICIKRANLVSTKKYYHNILEESLII